ncbi:MAG TPA: hypothetical protein VJ753_07675 [Rhizomicrobium sp.]|nr:hypothetical protein [Rhizomicrobium sp.]HJT44368.1 hypothetical protein [Rhizomicrobium sp.]
MEKFCTDKFNVYGPVMDTPDSSAKALAPVTPDDDNNLPGGIARGLLVGTAGTANIIDGSGNNLTGVPLQQGYNPIQVRRVLTGGTADDIWALF